MVKYSKKNRTTDNIFFFIRQEGFLNLKINKMAAVQSSGKAVTTKKTFSRETAVSIDIQADKSIILGITDQC